MTADHDNGTESSVNKEHLLIRKRLQHGVFDQQYSQPHHKDLNRASVLVLLSKDNRILLTLRSKNLKSHPGQVSFPGGKQDDEDNNDDVFTAFRETKEEVGLDCFDNDNIQVLCTLPTIESINHLCVISIVAQHATQTSQDLTSQLKLNTCEVDAAFWVPLEYFWKTEPDVARPLDWRGVVFVYREYNYIDTSLEEDRKFKITGLTAHIAHEVAKMAFDHDNDEQDSVENHEKSNDLMSGSLWRLNDESNRNPFWSQRYFVLTNHQNILHQYDNESQAFRKSQSANKKNRLLLSQDLKIEYLQNDDDDEKYPFQVSVLDGRIIWKLAAKSQTEREQWKEKIMLALANAV